MLAAAFAAAAGTLGCKLQRLNLAAEGLGPVWVEDVGLHCTRLIWLLKETRNQEKDIILPPSPPPPTPPSPYHYSFPADFKRNKTRLDQIHKLKQGEICLWHWGDMSGHIKGGWSWSLLKAEPQLLWDPDLMLCGQRQGWRPLWKEMCALWQPEWMPCLFGPVGVCSRVGTDGHVCSLWGSDGIGAGQIKSRCHAVIPLHCSCATKGLSFHEPNWSGITPC